MSLVLRGLVFRDGEFVVVEVHPTHRCPPHLDGSKSGVERRRDHRGVLPRVRLLELLGADVLFRYPESLRDERLELIAFLGAHVLVVVALD